LLLIAGEEQRFENQS